MLTICWAAKGGSGTTVYATARAVASDHDSLLVDLAGDVPNALGVPEPDGPGIGDWLSSDAPAERLARLEQRVTDGLSIIVAGHAPNSNGDRWFELAAHLRADGRSVVVDAGTGAPPPALLAAADESLLILRSCYLGVRRAVASTAVPTGVVFVDEPGRRLSPSDIEAALGVPVVDTVLLDPAIARAVDAGLLVSRLPGAWRRRLRSAA